MDAIISRLVGLPGRVKHQEGEKTIVAELTGT
jgi:hypothetical protein